MSSSPLRVAVVQLATRPADRVGDRTPMADEPYALGYLGIDGPEFSDLAMRAELSSKTIGRLRRDSTRRYRSSLDEKLRQILRYLFLNDVSIVVLTTELLPFESLSAISDFTTRMTVVGRIAPGGVDPAEARARFSAEWIGSETRKHGWSFTFSPLANYFGRAGTWPRQVDVTPSLDGPRVSVSIVGSDRPLSTGASTESPDLVVALGSSNVPALTTTSHGAQIAAVVAASARAGGSTIVPARSASGRSRIAALGEQSEGLLVADLPLRSGTERGRRVSLWTRAPVLYAERDEDVVELIGALSELSQQGKVSRTELDEVRERFAPAFRRPGRHTRALLRAIHQIRGDERIPPRLLRSPVLPDSVMAPEELEYQGVEAVLPQARRLLEDPRASAASQTSLREAVSELTECQAALAPYVRPELRTLAHRVPEVPGSATGQREHWIFYATLTAFDPSELDRALARQLTMLRTLARLGRFQLSITYRLLTMRSESRDLEAVFEVVCRLDDGSEELAQELRETFGELVHAAFVGIYGLQFSFERPSFEDDDDSDTRLARPRYQVELLPVVHQRRPAAFAGRPDWGYVVDYLRSLSFRTVIEMQCRASGTLEEDGGAGGELDETRLASSEWAAKDLAEDSALEAVVAAAGHEARSLELRILIGADEPIPASLSELLAVELGGGERIEARLLPLPAQEAQLAGGARRISPGAALRVFHPPFGEFFQATGLGRRPRDLPTGRSSFPLVGTMLGYARRTHAKADRWIPVRISAEDRVRHMYVLGRTGTGKTNLLKTIAASDLATPGRGLAVIDPHGDLAQHVMNSLPRLRLSDAHLLDFSDPDVVPTINPLLFDKTNHLHRSRAIQEVIELLRSRIFHQWTGPRFDQMVRLALETLLDDGYDTTPSLIEVPLLFTDEDFQQHVRSGISDPDLAARWSFHDRIKQSREYAETVDWATSKFDDISRDETLRCVLGGSRNSVDFDQVLSKNQILIVHVPESVVGRQAADLIGSLVLLRLRLALYGRGFATTEGRHQGEFSVIVDEFQKFATANFDELVAEARKFGVGFTLAHQNLEQLREFSTFMGGTQEQLLRSILGNVGSFVIFGVGAPEAEVLATQLGVPAEVLMSVCRHRALARLTIDGVETATFTLRTAYAAPRTNPRMLDDLRNEQLLRGLLRRRDEAIFELEERVRLVKRDATVRHTEDELAARPAPRSSFLDEWLERRRRTPQLRAAQVADDDDEFDDDESGLDQAAGRRIAHTIVQDVRRVSARSWDELVGPFFALATAAERLGIDEGSVLELAEKRALLVLRTRRATPVVPQFQIVDGTVLPGLERVLDAFRDALVDGWTLSAWLMKERDVLSGSSVAGWLRTDGDVEMAVRVAELAASRFAR